MKIFDLIKEQIAPLPLKVKLSAAAFLICLVVGLVVSSIGFIGTALEVRSLHKQNQQLEKAAAQAQNDAANYELNAANEALHSKDLEQKLKTLEAKGNSQDNEIQIQTQKSSNLRNSLTRVRELPAKSISTDELERRLNARYGQKVGN